MAYEVVDFNNKVLAVFNTEAEASTYWRDNPGAYDYWEDDNYVETENYEEVIEIQKPEKPVVVVFWWRNDVAAPGWYGQQYFRNLADARAQYNAWTAEGKLVNYVAL